PSNRASPRSWAPTGKARPTSSRRSHTCPRSDPTASPVIPPSCAQAPPARSCGQRGSRANVRRSLKWGSSPAGPAPPAARAAPPLRPTRARGRPRELPGHLRTVLFAPEDLALIKGDPGGRRRFLDVLLVLFSPRLASVRAEYDRVIKQRNALLKSAGAARR